MAPPSLDKDNPYSAPGADLTESFQQEERQFVAEGISVGTDRVMTWYSRGFELFKAQPGIWIVNFILFFVLFFVMGLIPLLGLIASNVLLPVFVGGFMLCCAAQVRHQPIFVGHLFEGFKNSFGPLAMVGVLNLVGLFVLGVVVVVLCLVVAGIAGMGALTGMMMGKDAAGGMMAGGIGLIGILLIVLLVLAVSVPLFMAIWFAPCLIIFHNMQALEAMKASFSGCLKNIVPFLVYGVLYIIFAIVASIPLGLGWVVLGPVLFASIYFSYQDIYLRN